MEMSCFEPLLEAAELLKDTQTRDALLQMRSVYQEKQYFVAFIGQYSAGKSCLLNSLLRRQLLPEGITETTPLLTYIRYGEREEARLHDMDGAVQVLELEQVAQLVQQAEGGRWKMDRLEFLEVFLNEDMLRAGMILLDTPGVNTLIERHERLLDASLAMAADIVYVAGHAPSLVDADKLSMLTKAGFDVRFVRTHCDEIKAREETLEQVRAADQATLTRCGIGADRCYYISNKAESPLFAALEPLRDMLIQKGRHTNEALEIGIEGQLRAQAEAYRDALERRRALLEQVCAKNTEAMERRQAELLEKIKRLTLRLEEREAALSGRVQECGRTLQEEVKGRLEEEIQRSAERIAANESVSDEAQMAELLRREAAAFSKDAYQLINVSLDSLVRDITDAVPAKEMGLELAAVPQVDDYQNLCMDQDERAAQLRNRLIALQESQEEITQALAAKAGSPEYTQLQQELQALESGLMEIRRERADLPPYVPQMIAEEDGSMQPSQIARSIGAAADWIMLLIPGANIEAAFTKAANLPAVAKRLGKFVGVLEKAGQAMKKGDTIKDILFTMKNLSDHTRTSKRREAIAAGAVEKIAKGARAGVDAINNAKQNGGSESILSLLTIEHWAEKFGAQFDRPPLLSEDQEYKARYEAEKSRLETACREQQQQAYQKKLELGLFRKEEERLKAREASLRVDREAVSKELSRREAALRAAAKQEAFQKWRGGCANWYRNEMARCLRETIDSYTSQVPARLEEYRQRRFQALREALEKERAAYDELRNAPEEEAASELRRVNALLEGINNAFFH